MIGSRHVLKPEAEHLARQHRLLHKTAATQHHHVTCSFALLKNNHIPRHQSVGGASPYPPLLNDRHNVPLIHQIHQLCMLLPQRHTQYCHSKERKTDDDGGIGVIRAVPQVRQLKGLQSTTAACQHAVWPKLLYFRVYNLCRSGWSLMSMIDGNSCMLWLEQEHNALYHQCLHAHLSRTDKGRLMVAMSSDDVDLTIPAPC